MKNHKYLILTIWGIMTLIFSYLSKSLWNIGSAIFVGGLIGVAIDALIQKIRKNKK